jgi:hypothetical protein
MGRRRPDSWRPTLLGLEARSLMSIIPALIASSTLQVQKKADGGSGSAGNGQGGSTSGNQFLDPTGTPTPHEAQRQKARFSFDGKCFQGPGRYSDVASLVLFRGFGSSNYFLHGDIQLAAQVPTDLTRPTSGAATSFDRNINTNSVLGIDLSGSTADVDKAGRPTRLTFTIDNNLSGGDFGQAVGTGVVTIRYSPARKHRAGASSEGTAHVTITGDIYTLGTNNLIRSPLSTNNTLDPRKIRI